MGSTAQSEKAPAILYFGNDWFAENRTSSHHLARRLAKDYRVYYIECPGLRAPKRSGRDFKKIWVKLSRFLRGVQTVEGGLKVRTLLQIPLHRFATVRWLNRLLIVATLRRLMWRERIHHPMAWFLIPHLSCVVGRLGESLSVYYCTDDHTALPDVNVAAVRSMDEEMTRKANIVFVVSDTLLQAKRQLNPNTYVSPHGVDFDHFVQAQGHQLPVPADTAKLAHPIIGFHGLIEKYIDLDLIDHLAEQRPQWNFVLIGRVAVPDAQLPRRPNVHFLGRRSYESLPAYGKQFDVSIIPYRLCPFTLHANPLKLREYLALGKPVVSVSTPAVNKYADVVEIAHSRSEFLAKLDAALARPPSPGETKRRLDRVARESWEARLREVQQVIARHLTRSAEQPRFFQTNSIRSVGHLPNMSNQAVVRRALLH